MTLIYLLLGMIAVSASLSIYQNIKVDRLRKEGKYPEKGKITRRDILGLLKTGNEVLAIRAYRELYKVGLKEAKELVDKMRKEAN